MEIIERKEVKGLAVLYLARFRRNSKLLAEFVDTVEVGVGRSKKWVMMISTQYGCPVGCAICDSGSFGFRGNMTHEEIISQVEYIVDANPGLDLRNHPKVKIHFARTGEPSLNPHASQALRSLALKFPFPGILPSISTIGPRAKRSGLFFEETRKIKNTYFANGRFQLQLSLHSTDESQRRRLIPFEIFTLREMAEFGRWFWSAGDRKITLNFAFAPDADMNSARVAELFSPDIFLIKVTPVNPTKKAQENALSFPWMEPPACVERFCEELKVLGYDVLTSPSWSQEIEEKTSCGQLWILNEERTGVGTIPPPGAGGGPVSVPTAL